MKKILLTTLLLFFSVSICHGLTFEEDFEDATDYTEKAAGPGSDWVETDGGAGTTIDPNEQGAQVSNFPCSGSEILEFVYGDDESSRTTNTLDSEHSTLYIRYYFRITATDLASGERTYIFSARAEDNGFVWYQALSLSGAQYYTEVYVDDTQEVSETMNLNQTYRMELYYSGSGAANEWEVKIDGVSKDTGSSAAKTGIDEFYFGANGSTMGYTLFVDNYEFDTSGYPGAETCSSTSRRVILMN